MIPGTRTRSRKSCNRKRDLSCLSCHLKKLWCTFSPKFKNTKKIEREKIFRSDRLQCQCSNNNSHPKISSWRAVNIVERPKLKNHLLSFSQCVCGYTYYPRWWGGLLERQRKSARERDRERVQERERKIEREWVSECRIHGWICQFVSTVTRVGENGD